jgi:hypothetical protein
MLLLLFFWKRAHRPLRALLVTYVLAMAFTLVYTGEHFVADEVLGWSYAIFVYFAGSHVLNRRAARREAKRQHEQTRATGAHRVELEVLQPDSAVG